MPLLVLLFVVVPIVELYVLIQVGQVIGVWWTLALLIVDSILGSLLMRSQGRAAWQRFQLALAEGRPPAREVLDGALVIFGGAFLLTPGFVTDILGLVLLLPPTRALVRRAVIARFLPLMVLRTVGRAWRPAPRARTPYDVEGTAVDVERDRLP
jgi:UPF0716 protein FxsA